MVKKFYLCCILLSILFTCSIAKESGQEKKVLIINSYHKGFDWSDRVVRGMEKIFYKHPNITFSILYMDSKRISSKEYYAKLIELYKLQLKNRKYDLVVAVDTFAYDFVLTYYHELFTDEPLFFSGPEQYSLQRIMDLGLEDRVYGLIEQRAIKKNFLLIDKAMPYLKKLTIINDSSDNGNDTHPAIMSMIEKYSQKFYISYIRKSSIEELKKMFAVPKKDEAVLFVRFYNEVSGKFNKNSQIASMIKSFQVPVFVTDTLFYGLGAFGGKLVDVDKLGMKSGTMALEILKHNIKPLHVEVFDDFFYGFDYEKIKQFSTNPNEYSLKNFQIINAPLGFFDKYRTFVNDIFLLTPLLLLLIAGLIYNTYKRIQGEKELQIAQEQRNKHQQFVIQQSKLAEIGEIFSSIAHQWKNPLVEISAIAQEQLYKNKEEDSAYVHDIMVQVKYMSDTLGNFQKFIVPSPKQVVFNIEESIDTVLKIMAHTIKYNYIDVEIVKKKAHNFTISGYKNEFMQTLLNILNNAKDQIHQAREEQKITRGKIKIHLYNEKEHIHVDICDNGGGIKQTSMQKIFEPYYTTKKGGHGIGLYMTKLIIEHKMQGSIGVKNTPEGACFMIKVENVNENTTT